MRKLLFVLPAALALIAVGCQTAPQAEYYPLEVGTAWTYHQVTTVITTTSVPVPVVDTTVTTKDYTSEVMGKDKLAGGDEVFVFKTTYTDTTPVQTTYLRVAADSVYSYAALTDSTAMYAEPTKLAVGQTWSHDYLGSHFTATVEGTETVTVPAGTYAGSLRIKGIVSTGSVQAAPVYQYRAKNVGLVKTTVADTTGVAGVYESVMSSVTELQTYVP